MFRIVGSAFLMWCLLLGSRTALEADRLDLFVLAQFAINVLYLVSVYLIVSSPIGRREIVLICSAALLLRFTTALWTPALSEDLYRYRWEGQLQAAGGNPYQVRPADPEWAWVRDETWLHIGQKDFKAGYGPLIEMLEHGWYLAVSPLSVKAQVIAFKLPFLVAELLVLLLVWHLAGPGKFVWYALAPLPMVEVWWNGHNDPLPVAAMLGALLAARRERWGWAFAVLGMGIAAKWWPVLLVPAFLSESPSRSRWKCVFTFLPAAIGMFPYWGDVSENAAFMTGFIGGWRNNDSLFGLLLWLAGSAAEAKRIAMGLITLLIVTVAFRPWSLERKCLLSITIALLLSSNCHPWYLLWIWPLVAMCPMGVYFLWGAIMPLAYSVLGEWRLQNLWDGSTSDRWWIFGPVFAYAALELIFRWRTHAVRHSREKGT